MKPFEFDVPLGSAPDDKPASELDYERGELSDFYQAFRFEKLHALFEKEEKDVAWHDFLTVERLALERQYLYEYPVADYQPGGILFENAKLRADSDWALFKHFKNGKITMRNDFLRLVYRENEKPAQPEPAENPPAKTEKPAPAQPAPAQPAPAQPAPAQPEPTDADDWSAFY